MTDAYKRSLRCADCQVDTGATGEWYMVRDAVWERAWPGTSQPDYVRTYDEPCRYILCIGCLEARLGRELTRQDFVMGGNYGSARLRDRWAQMPEQAAKIDGILKTALPSWRTRSRRSSAGAAPIR
jgi:hypothetical protein